MPNINIAINAVNNSRAALRQFMADTSAMNARVRQVEASAIAAGGGFDRYGRSAAGVHDVNRRMGVSFGNLLVLMAKFGIAMQIITLPNKMIASLMGAVKTTIEWETALRQTNTILRLNNEQLGTFSNEMIRVSLATGGTLDVMKATFDAAQQLVGLKFENVNQITNGLTAEANAIKEIVEVAQRGAIASRADVSEITNSLTQVMSALAIPATKANAEAISDMMFSAQKLSDINVSDIAKNMGELLPMVADIASGDPARAMKELNEAMAVLAAMSQTLGPERAFTAFRQLPNIFLGTNEESKRLRAELNKLGVEFSLAQLKGNGIAATFGQLTKILPSSQIMDRLVEDNRELADSMGEANYRFQVFRTIIDALFPNLRASRGVMAMLINEGAIFNETVAKQAEYLGQAAEAFDQMSQSAGFAQSRLAAAGNAIRMFVGFHIIPSIASASNLIADFVANIVTDENFQKMSLPQKIFAFMNNFNAQFSNWFMTGGKEKIKSTAQEIGSAFAEFFAGMIGKDSTNVYAQAGRDAIQSFIKGMGSVIMGGGERGFVGNISNIAGGWLTRVAGGAFLGRQMIGGMRGGLLGGAAGLGTLALSGSGGGTTDALFSTLAIASMFGGAGRMSGFLKNVINKNRFNMASKWLLSGGSTPAEAGRIIAGVQPGGSGPLYGGNWRQNLGVRLAGGGILSAAKSGLGLGLTRVLPAAMLAQLGASQQGDSLMSQLLGIGSFAGSGALAGSMFGPWGAGIGALLGGGVGLWNVMRKKNNILPQVEQAMSAGYNVNSHNTTTVGDINIYARNADDLNTFIDNLAEYISNAHIGQATPSLLTKGLAP
jgi:hypothetical protein